MAITETAIHFSAPSEALATEGAGFRRGGGSQDAASAYGVAELPECAGKVFFSEEVFREIPAFEGTGENQFEFGLSFLLVAAVTTEEIGAAVVAYDLEQRFVCAVDVGEFEVEDGIDPELAAERADAILPTETSEQRALACCGLSVKVKLGGPPGFDSVFQFQGAGDERVAAFGGAGDVLGGNLKRARIFQVVGIGDEIIFLGVDRKKTQRENGEQGPAGGPGWEYECQPGFSREKGHRLVATESHLGITSTMMRDGQASCPALSQDFVAV